MRRTEGFWEMALSSRKTIHARMREAFFLPLPWSPAATAESYFIALFGLQRRSLQTPPHFLKDFPNVSGVKVNTGRRTD